MRTLSSCFIISIACLCFLTSIASAQTLFGVGGIKNGAQPAAASSSSPNKILSPAEFKSAVAAQDAKVKESLSKQMNEQLAKTPPLPPIPPQLIPSPTASTGAGTQATQPPTIPPPSAVPLQQPAAIPPAPIQSVTPAPQTQEPIYSGFQAPESQSNGTKQPATTKPAESSSGWGINY